MNNCYMDYMISEKKSPHTIRAYVSDIDNCMEFLGKPENEVKYIDLINWKGSIIHLASGTVARKVIAIKKYFGYLYDIEAIESNPAEKLKSVKIENKQKTPLSIKQVRLMIDNADKIRSKAIIMLLASTGLRISEMIGLTIDQYQNQPMTIVGKGNKKRLVYLTQSTCNLIDEYLEVRGESEYDNIFLSSGNHPMQANNISLMLKNTAHKAGLDNWNNISNHWLRTTAATLQSEAGQPIEVIQDMLGHASITTTKRYVKTTKARLENAMTRELI